MFASLRLYVWRKTHNRVPWAVNELMKIIAERTDNNTPVLTGSRYFGTHTPKSDYDFFMSDSEIPERHVNIVNVLRTAGFTRERGTGYGDFATTLVFYHQKLNIHMQLTAPRWFDAKMCAQERIKKCALPLLVSLPKRQRHYFWDLMIDFATKE